MKHNYFLLFLFVSFVSVCNAQTKINFKYDESGNQIFRGYEIYLPPLEEHTESVLTIASEDEKFWSKIHLYPVPVREILTITWEEDIDYLIDNVTLYQHNTIANVFQKKNIPNINRNIKINMSGMYMGVYILNFQLKDGRIMSRNIIRL